MIPKAESNTMITTGDLEHRELPKTDHHFDRNEGATGVGGDAAMRIEGDNPSRPAPVPALSEGDADEGEDADA